ncbi:hypothetical protein QBZ16_002561 [Prototheca wickerhamii]|uniref:Conserved oligomeric Golgi complex subunit 2 n=1 Tax=Prototheca wickerhamii TaxID=3111 RepID=A0AAD9MNI8_PROWI|nr:hypothetical protein QBZ16_002561 [Prototheca wickerhamii]
MSVWTPDLRQPSLPAWLKPDEFGDPDFNPVTYVANLQHYVPLNVLQQELQSHLSVIHNQLVEVINADYDGFVNLTTRMSNLQGAVKRIEAPLAQVQTTAAATRETALAETSALSHGLTARSEVSASRAVLELMQDLAHVLSKIDKLLAEIPPAEGGAFLSPASTPEEVETRCHMLNRVTAEVARVVYLSKKGEDLAFVRALSPRVKATMYLDLVLAAAVAQQVPSALGACLNSYASIDRREAAEQESVSSSEAAPALRLETLLARFEEGMQRELGPFLAHVLSPSAGIQSFDFLGAGVLAEVTRVAQRTCPGDLGPGVPDAFHAGCRAGLAFLTRLEALCGTAEQVERFRAGAAHSAFVRLWNLPAYYGLRFQEVAGALEGALEGAALDPREPAGGAGVFRLEASAACWEALVRTASPDVLLPGLGERFFRLGLMCLGRYAAWARVLSELGVADAEAARATGGSVQAARVGLASAAEEATASLARGLVAECSAALTQLRGVVASFRVANRRAPSAASPYAARLLAPLRAALAAHEPARGRELAAAVVDGLCEQYRAVVIDTLVTVAKTESSLRRLKSRQRMAEPEAAGAADGPLDTSALVAKQLHLDVEALGKQMAGLGVDPASRPSFVELQAALQAPAVDAPGAT